MENFLSSAFCNGFLKTQKTAANLGGQTMTCVDEFDRKKKKTASAKYYFGLLYKLITLGYKTVERRCYNVPEKVLPNL